MAMYLSPLVDVNEIDLTTTIPAVATSIGVLILRDTWKGPELKTQLVNDIDELIDTFGRPEDALSTANANFSARGQSYEDIIAGAGFLQFGNNLYCTRVLAPSATFSVPVMLLFIISVLLERYIATEPLMLLFSINEFLTNPR